MATSRGGSMACAMNWLPTSRYPDQPRAGPGSERAHGGGRFFRQSRWWRARRSNLLLPGECSSKRGASCVLLGADPSIRRRGDLRRGRGRGRAWTSVSGGEAWSLVRRSVSRSPARRGEGGERSAQPGRSGGRQKLGRSVLAAIRWDRYRRRLDTHPGLRAGRTSIGLGNRSHRHCYWLVVKSSGLHSSGRLPGRR